MNKFNDGFFSVLLIIIFLAIMVVFNASGDSIHDLDKNYQAISFSEPGEKDVIAHETTIPPIFEDQVNNSSVGDSYDLSGEQATDIKTYGEVIMIPVTPTPEGSGYSYYNPNGTDPSYVIYSPGNYILESGFSTENKTGINITASSVTLDGNRQVLNGSIDGIGIHILGPYVTIKNFAKISGFDTAIWLEGKYVSIIDNTFFSNAWRAIFGYTDYGYIHNNTVSNTTHFLEGRSFQNTIISENYLDASFLSLMSSINISFIGNTFSNSYVEESGGSNIIFENNIFKGRSGYSNLNGVSSKGLVVSGNTFNSTNINYYYNNDTLILHNSFTEGSNILVHGINTTISGNTILNNSKLYGIGKNSIISDNIILNNENGVELTSNTEGIPGYTSWTVTGNKIFNNSGYGLKVGNLTQDSPGKIYNNYFANTNNIGGEGEPSWFIWTNPAGPQQGTNVIGGPYIAGNYWSNLNSNGWSDLQPVNPNGYSTTPYEITPGVNDSAPLVQTGSPVPHIISARADQGGSISPSGVITVPDGDDQAFKVTPDQGMKVASVIVDNINQGAIRDYTFKDVRFDHTIYASFTSLVPDPKDTNTTVKEWGIINSPIIIESHKFRNFTASEFK